MGKHNNFMPSKDMVYLRRCRQYGIFTKTGRWDNCSHEALTKEAWKTVRNNRIKLPKSWKHWCRVCGLKISDGKRNSGFYLKGRGYHWRVNCFGMFQRGDDYEQFDKWARCEIDEVPVPKTLQEFKDAVEKLLYCAHR